MIDFHSFYQKIKSIYSHAESKIIFNELVIKFHEDSQWYSAINDLLKHKPYQYITNKAYFLDLELFVNQNVLIPRPETEELILLIKNTIPKNQNYRILEIGTGSGCISIALSKIFDNSNILAIDNSLECIEIAKRNQINTKSDNIKFCKIDFLDTNEWEKLGIFDLIISNPPYIKESEIVNMSKNVVDFEPKNALFVPNSNPLIFYYHILEFANKYLAKNGNLFLETHQDYFLDKYPNFNIKNIKDMSNNYRFIIGSKN